VQTRWIPTQACSLAHGHRQLTPTQASQVSIELYKQCMHRHARLLAGARSLSLALSLSHTHTHTHTCTHRYVRTQHTHAHNTHTKAQTQLHPYTHTHTLPISLTHIHISPIRPHTHIPYLTRTYTRKSAEISRNKHTCMIVNLCACVCMRSC